MRTLILAAGGFTVPDSISSHLEAIHVIETIDGLAARQPEDYDLIVVRVPLPGTPVEALLEEIHRVSPRLPVVLWAARATTAEAVRLSQLGACQVVTDDMSPDEILHHIESAVYSGQGWRVESGRDAGEREPWRRQLVGESWPMRMMSHVIRLVGPKRCTVLITGETGTGKEVVARCIHQAGPRAAFPLVSLNCAALPEELLEAELFGHVKGAFTGAFTTRVGRFEQAHRGTLFLDEIGEMPFPLQAKLLRVLQEREFQKVGSSETIRVDVRVIAASNGNLARKVREGSFREDLYYRLRVVPVHLPPLRQRKEDIPALTFHFVEKVCAVEGIRTKVISSDVIDHLMEYDWPGNVRELENTIEMAVALSGERRVLLWSDFPVLINGLEEAGDVPQVSIEGLDYERAVDEFERRLLLQALRTTGGNKKMAAKLLMLKRTTFLAKLRSLNVLGEDEQEVEEEPAPRGSEEVGGLRRAGAWTSSAGLDPRVGVGRGSWLPALVG